MSHVRLAPTPEDLSTVRIAAGGANLVLGCDMVVAASIPALPRRARRDQGGRQRRHAADRGLRA